ncbi:MAG: hypothetical protein ACPHHQ_07965 [Pseudomonadales bacterium]
MGTRTITNASHVLASAKEGQALTLRSAALVMDLDRFGALQPSRLSFMRTLVRRMAEEAWRIHSERFELDDQGHGEAVYRVVAGSEEYRFVVFSRPLSDEQRNDRVISNQWDLTMALVQGELTGEQLKRLRINVPLQEAGRVDDNVLVLSRANRSSRSFQAVIERLAAGMQPDVEHLKVVGYLCRTTAVYGSGKFGMADWQVVQSYCHSFRTPFSAEMFACFMLRHFSCEQVEHIARVLAPGTAVSIAPHIKRYIGIGNATGLGMAPFLIKHPKLIAHWMLQRETALARVLSQSDCDDQKLDALKTMLAQVIQHLNETTVDERQQQQRNDGLVTSLSHLIDALEQPAFSGWLKTEGWSALQSFVADRYGIDTDELVQVLLFEFYPDLVDPLEESMAVDEDLDLEPHVLLSECLALIKTHYDWALGIDFQQPDHHALFWYRSEEKMEPRLGDRFFEMGAEKEMPMLIAYAVRECCDLMDSFVAEFPDSLVVDFLMQHPNQLGIVRRIQGLSKLHYGDIRGNLSDKNLQPMHLLRAKLSFFGVGKFDPKSRLWVRNTMFQGAPLVDDINAGCAEDRWYFPVAPVL